MLNGGTREQRRHAYALERRAKKSGDWGTWERIDLPAGLPGGSGWTREVRYACKSNLYVALVRPVSTDWGEVHHLAIRTASNLEPPWRDKQRMKNELFGEDYLAVEVMPPTDELVDEADMYHMWILPRGMRLPFTLASDRRTLGLAA